MTFYFSNPAGRGEVSEQVNGSARRADGRRNASADTGRRIGSDIGSRVGAGKTSWQRLRDGAYGAFGKRMLDIVLATVILIIVLPVILLMALFVALDGANPFFSHQRVGLNGRLFGCLKIRTMVRDAERKLADVLENDPVAAAEWKQGQKLSKDPRVTRLGRFLRWSSLDELPQLWNVIRGDMSLVGPRPVVPEELERYGAHKGAYMSVRPGITGPWQAEGRNSLSYDARVALDRAYARSYSLMGDLRLLLLTAVQLVRKPSGV